jgi:hypothetical protein
MGTVALAALVFKGLRGGPRATKLWLIGGGMGGMELMWPGTNRAKNSCGPHLSMAVQGELI